MKLDFLQFLELEVFTRFGAKLESSMQKKIEHGRVLREVLKQDRLSPVPIESQMAWLVAFNDGLLDTFKPETICSALASLFRWVASSGLTQAMTRDQWRTALDNWKKAGRVS
jgi:F-type H+-transporting ATPase subunit alpha